MKNLDTNKVNTCMAVCERYQENQPNYQELATQNPRYLSFRNNMGPSPYIMYENGTLVVCVGKVMRDTHHYEAQPFYRLLLPNGTVAEVSKSTRAKYFEYVRPEQNTRETNNK